MNWWIESFLEVCSREEWYEIWRPIFLSLCKLVTWNVQQMKLRLETKLGTCPIRTFLAHLVPFSSRYSTWDLGRFGGAACGELAEQRVCLGAYAVGLFFGHRMLRHLPTIRGCVYLRGHDWFHVKSVNLSRGVPMCVWIVCSLDGLLGASIVWQLSLAFGTFATHSLDRRNGAVAVQAVEVAVGNAWGLRATSRGAECNVQDVHQMLF